MSDEVSNLIEEYLSLIPPEQLRMMEQEQKHAVQRLQETLEKMSRFPNQRFIELCELYRAIVTDADVDQAFEVAVGFRLWDEAKLLQSDEAPSVWHAEFERLVDEDAPKEERIKFIVKVMDALIEKVKDCDYSGLANDVSCAISFL